MQLTFENTHTHTEYLVIPLEYPAHVYRLSTVDIHVEYLLVYLVIPVSQHTYMCTMHTYTLTTHIQMYLVTTVSLPERGTYVCGVPCIPAPRYSSGITRYSSVPGVPCDSTGVPCVIPLEYLVHMYRLRVVHMYVE